MSNLSEWLLKLCSLGEIPVRWDITTPFYVANLGYSWTIATNGKMMVAIAGVLSGYESGPDFAHRAVSPFLGPITEWNETIPLGLLCSWCGPAEYKRQCDCHEGCDQCDHTGIIDPEPRPGKLLGMILDRKLLACALEGLEGDTIRIAWQGIRNGFPGPVTLEPEQPLPSGQPPWRVAILPMCLGQDEADQVELFSTGEFQSSWLYWNNHTVLKLARAIQEERAFNRLPILADALEEAGCDQEDILAHCRRVAPHPCGCWVIDLLTGSK